MESNFEFCLIGKYTDTGRVRKANEDGMDVFDANNMKVFVVCDGMGGHVGGQIASQTAIATIKQFMLNHVFTDPCEAINNAIIAANTAIIQRTREQPELVGMGSTCVMLIVTSDGKVYYGHIGDSRIYIVANHQIRQLTKDHSYVQTLVDAGTISKEQAEKHPRKNEITNALGLVDMKPPTLCNESIEPEAGNCFLLCSDGLSGMVDDRYIERIVSKHDVHIQERAKKLVQMANESGGSDNITVELVEFAVSSVKSVKEGKTRWTTPKKCLVSVGVVVIFVILFGYFFLKDRLSTRKKSPSEKGGQETEATMQPKTEKLKDAKTDEKPTEKTEKSENESSIKDEMLNENFHL